MAGADHERSQGPRAGPADLHWLGLSFVGYSVLLFWALDRADWNDSVRRDFEAQLKAATNSVTQTTQRLSELKPILGREIRALEHYLRHR